MSNEGENAAMPELDHTSLQAVLLALRDPQDLASAACVCRAWQSCCAADSLWAARLASDFGVCPEKVIRPGSGGWPGPPPMDTAHTSPRESWSDWNGAFGTKGEEAAKKRETVKRMCEVVGRLKKGLCSIGLSEVVDTFHRGHTEQELSALEAMLDLDLPLALRVLWSCWGGQQQVSIRTAADITPRLFYGALGGYGFYEFVQSMHLLSLPDAVKTTMQLTQNMDIPEKSVAMAASLNKQKQVAVRCDTGAVLIAIPGSRSPQPASPSPEELQDCTDVPRRDVPLLLWLENFVQMMEDKAIGAEPICKHLHSSMGIDSSLGVCLFPNRKPRPCRGLPYSGPVGSESLTHGVRVCARPLYIPEMSHGRRRLFFAYSIRMELLPGFHLQECQLVRRHWVIRGADGRVQDEVEGEGVVGEFPILRPGQPPFVYQSCTNSSAEGSSMEGHLEFVAGTLSPDRLQAARAASYDQANEAAQPPPHAAGVDSTFRVAVEPFTFCLPKYIY